jgi:hypothetical protein
VHRSVGQCARDNVPRPNPEQNDSVPKVLMRVPPARRAGDVSRYSSPARKALPLDNRCTVAKALASHDTPRGECEWCGWPADLMTLRWLVRTRYEPAHILTTIGPAKRHGKKSILSRKRYP